jgi:hypothetical protein
VIAVKQAPTGRRKALLGSCPTSDQLFIANLMNNNYNLQFVNKSLGRTGLFLQFPTQPQVLGWTWW